MTPRIHLPLRWAITLLAVLGAGPTPAEVLDAAPGGFTSRNAAVVAAPADSVYFALTAGFGGWWDPEHSYFGKGENFRVDPVPGGAWIEDAGDGRWLQHLQVINADPGRLLRLSGGLGPLQEMAVVGVLTWQLEPQPQGTAVTLTYAVGGYCPQGLDTLAPIVDMVLGQQLQRLQAHLASRP